MGASIDKEKNDIVSELEDSPKMHIDARMSILADIGLSRDFSHTYLQAICKGHTGGKNEAGATTTMSLATVCESLAKQRVICYGAGSLASAGIRKFNFPAYEVVNGALALTEANTSKFGFVCTDLDETNTITLTSGTGTQTIDGNTFSTRASDYYLSRSRISGELAEISDNVSAYSTPDGLDVVFGNAVAWGSSVAGEESSNTWNYHWARANVSTVAVQGSDPYILNMMTLADHLTQGSNTDYTPLGPRMGGKYYLKRHADSVNTFTITGTTTTDDATVTNISDADILKIKYGDVISGTGITGAPTIDAVQSADSQIRIANVATANGTVTITVNSVPLGHAAHDIFCQIEVTAEGLVANSTWTPVGDLAGTYITGSEDDLCIADTDQFIAKLGFFDPASASGGGNENDLTKGASASYASDGKEYNGTSYPDIEKNPFDPSSGGSRKAYEVKSGEIVGTQPRYVGASGTTASGIGDKDIYVGRFIRFDKERANASGALPEFRYVTDSAEKFFYAPQANATYGPIGSATTVASHPMPNVAEPRATLPRTGLASVVTIVRADETLAVVGSGGTRGSSNATANFTIPADDVIHADGSNGTFTGSVTATSTSYYYRVNNGIIEKRSYVTSYAQANSTYQIATNADGPTVDHPIVTNYIARKLTTDGSTANADVAFIQTVTAALKSATVGAGGARFRDPIMEGAGTKHVTSASANDANFDTYLAATSAGVGEWDTDLAAVKTALADFYTTAGMSARNTRLEGGTDNVGASVNCAVATTTNFDSSVNVHAKWVAFSTECGTLVTTCDARIAEIDARIGKPIYAGSPSGVNSPPAVYVSHIPASNTTSGFVPYGRSLYNNCNHLLGQDVNLLGGIIKDIEGLTELVGMVKTARNKYEIYSGRDKKYA